MDVTETPRSPLLNSGQPTVEEGRAAITSDFETFLRMLTAQIQNQDPLNPVDSTDFATQLATFSSVEQQVLTNDLLTALGGQIGALGVSQLSSWVGMTARAIMPVNFGGEPVRIITQGSDRADAAQLVVRNETGAEVARYDIAPEETELDWQGLGANGQPLAQGIYQLDVEHFLAGEVINTDPVLVESRIIEARSVNGEAILLMNSGQEVTSANVVGLRER